MKNILVDADGVLLDWLKGFSLFLKHHHDIQVDPDLHYSWELHNWVGASSDETQKFVKQFNSGSWEFGCLPAYGNSVAVIKRLHQQGFTFSVITACDDSEMTIALRRANLFHLFGDVFDDVHCIGFNQSKSPILAKFQSSWWIEDKVSNAIAGLEFNHLPIILEQNHNARFKDQTPNRVQWCKNWDEIEVILQKS